MNDNLTSDEEFDDEEVERSIEMGMVMLQQFRTRTGRLMPETVEEFVGMISAGFLAGRRSMQIKLNKPSRRSLKGKKRRG